MTLRELENQRVVTALKGVGIDVQSVYDLINKPIDYRKAIPLLVTLLNEVNEEVIKEGIVRALSVKPAKGIATRRLVEEFRRVEPSNELNLSLKWTIGNALTGTADESVADDLIELIQDRRHGSSRQMLALALATLKDGRTADVLMNVIDDPDLTGHAIMALGKLRATRARAAIARYLDHPKAWVRKEAKKALERINQARA